jgi:hypothetical protein
MTNPKNSEGESKKTTINPRSLANRFRELQTLRKQVLDLETTKGLQPQRDIDYRLRADARRNGSK